MQYCWITHFWLGIAIQPGSVAHYGQMQGFVLCFFLVESAGLCPQEVCLFSWKDRRCVGHWDGMFSLSWRWDLGGNVQLASSLSLCLCSSFPAWSLLVTPGLGLFFCWSLSCLALHRLYPRALAAVTRGCLCLALARKASCMWLGLGLPKSTLGSW